MESKNKLENKNRAKAKKTHFKKFFCLLDELSKSSGAERSKIFHEMLEMQKLEFDDYEAFNRRLKGARP